MVARGINAEGSGQGKGTMSDQPGLAKDLDDSALETKGWPPALIKAASDSFDYAAFVETLGIVRFEYVIPCTSPDWVTLVLLPGENAKLPFSFARGIDVRLADIRWVADAPQGS